jgi:hypothetical protein
MNRNNTCPQAKVTGRFCHKQRAYFEEVDAFGLPEEEASETELE